MNEISIGAVGAAAIAGLVSLLGLVIAKEQKVSEFRQLWIDELRKCFVSYLVNINAISDVIRSQGKEAGQEKESLLAKYMALNEASNGIKLRINGGEGPAKRLLLVMREFEDLAASDKTLTPDNIQGVEEEFLVAAKELLKFEWRRVKRGEPIFVWTKRVVVGVTVLMLIVTIFAVVFQSKEVSTNATGEVAPSLGERECRSQDGREQDDLLWDGGRVWGSGLA